MSGESSSTPLPNELAELFGSSLGINKAEHAQVWAELLEARSVDQGSAVCARGRHTSSLYLVREGELKVSLTSGSHTQDVVSLSPGDFFGELGLLSPGEGNADVIAQTDCELLELDSTAFARMKKEHPACARSMMHDAGKVLALRVMGLERVRDGHEEHSPEPGLLSRIAKLLFNFGND